MLSWYLGVRPYPSPDSGELTRGGGPKVGTSCRRPPETGSIWATAINVRRIIEVVGTTLHIPANVLD